MEDTKKNGRDDGHPEGCRCLMCRGFMGKNCGCGCHCHGRFFILRWVLGIIILAVVFCLGVKIGEFKGEFGRSGFGYHRYHQMMPMYYSGGYSMTQRWRAAVTPQIPASGQIPPAQK